MALNFEELKQVFKEEEDTKKEQLKQQRLELKQQELELKRKQLELKQQQSLKQAPTNEAQNAPNMTYIISLIAITIPVLISLFILTILLLKY